MPHSITYSQLFEALHTIPKERLQDTVTVFDPNKDEYIAVIETKVLDTPTQDLHPKSRCYNLLLEAGHFFLVLKT